MRSGEGNPVVTGGLNDHCSCRFRRKAVHRLQFHHAVAERANDAPAARGCSYCHRQCAKTNDPFWQNENRCFEKI